MTPNASVCEATLAKQIAEPIIIPTGPGGGTLLDTHRKAWK